MRQTPSMDEFCQIHEFLTRLYGPEQGQAAFERLRERLRTFRQRLPPTLQPALSQRDAVLITYGDQVTQPGESPLHSLADFCAATLRGAVSGIHLLPFFPYTSD